MWQGCMCVPAKKRENGTPSVRAATVNLARRQHSGTKKNHHRAGEEQGFPVCMEAFLTRGATMKFRHQRQFRANFANRVRICERECTL